MARIVFWGFIGGALLALLKLLEYKHFVHAYPTEVYGGLIAVLFTILGLYFGLRTHRRPSVVVVQEVRPPQAGPLAAGSEAEFEPDEEVRKDLAITPREHEILHLIGEGLSNREIGERIFVSENTVKTHAYRLFSKLEVRNRVQALQKGRELRLIP